MEYLLLIYHNESQFDGRTEPERQKMYTDYRELIQDLEKTGKFKGGNQLQSTATATTVRVRDGKQSITDGPFAETKEQLGGYFLVDARDVEEAKAIATRIPSVHGGSIEVRPVVAPRPQAQSRAS
jgi:hypothetical protein